MTTTFIFGTGEKMDIQYLLFLQNLRGATGGVFNEFFNALSKIAVDVMIFLPYLIFWCVDKGWGYRFMTSIWGGEVLNGIVKLTVCAYRPWIRSELIEPAGDSKTAATGYSFPSGHTMCATATYGNVFLWQYKKRRWLAILCGDLDTDPRYRFYGRKDKRRREETADIIRDRCGLGDRDDHLYRI